MPRSTDTGSWAGNTDGREGTAPLEPTPAVMDGRRIRSLRAVVDPIAPTGRRPSDQELGTVPGPNVQTATDPSSGSFSLLPPTVPPIATPSLHPAQEWEGRVVEVREDEFEAQLIDVTAGDVVPREVATIPLDDLDPESRAEICVEAVFRWVIGYERSVGGARREVSRIVFLDPPRLTERALARGREWAAWLREAWGDE